MRPLTRLCCVLFVTLLPLLSSPLTPTTSASNFTVNSLADTPDANLTDGLCADASGACTLRAAIQQANADLSADSIGFAVNGTINLTEALPSIFTSMTINGPGSSLLTVRRNTGDEYRIFTVSAAAVAISGLTVSNGRPLRGEPSFFSGGDGQPGGGIRNIGNLTLTGCVISGNSSGLRGIGFLPPISQQAHGHGGHGGGIYNVGHLTMQDCTVRDNRAAGGSPNSPGNAGGNVVRGAGGGIANSGVLTMTDCTVTNNVTGGGDADFSNGDAGPGGGIANFASDSSQTPVATLTNCNITDNRTGRGIRLGNGFNNVSSSGGYGGGIFNDSTFFNRPTMTLIKSTVAGNVTGDGANASSGEVSTAGSGGSGGGVYNTGTLTVTNSVVSGNRTGTGGASSGVNCSHGNGGDGGGIASPGGTLKLSQSTVVSNQTGLLGEPCGRDGLGGGLYGEGKLRSTIVSNNFVRFPSSAGEVFGTGTGFESLGYNYIGIGSGCCFTGTDRHGSVGAPGFNLHLDPTTLVPLPGSVALDAGLARDADDQPVNTDKRGAVRPFDFPTVTPQQGGDDSDIGAFERQSTDPTPTTAVQFDGIGGGVLETCAQEADFFHITRSGPKDGATVVTYVVTELDGGGAHQRGDFTYTKGTVTFAPGEESKTFPILISQDAYHEGPESLVVRIVGVEGGVAGAQSSFPVTINDDDDVDGTANPVDDNATFVCQHYHDFLSRRADPGGQAFWAARLDECGGDAACLDRRRVDVSAAFFLSIEFQNTGYFVIRVNKAALGDQPRVPSYFDFLDEAQEVARGVIVGQPGFEAVLEANKQRYAERFVQRAAFQAAHGGQTAAQFVDSLFANAGVTPTAQERDAAVTAFGAGGAAGQAAALRSVVESGSVFNKLYNESFVLMEYFGYLRRNPSDPPDNNLDGYQFWLDKLNSATPPGEDARDETVAIRRIRRAEMVRSFLRSTEYRGRFGGDPSRGNP
ncbi:MAG TPA: CSLREA domain-containing protein [Pyrinomonadaceae bacterium]|nr:CSLREA domain-containing protein [Pyrinomonadaceae bacterium]